ncbi:MAG: hypothetical protein AAGD09_11000 [Cyanobacteria bacterium P01_F01_bin.56]
MQLSSPQTLSQPTRWPESAACNWWERIGDDEINISQVMDCHGQNWWQVYNPQTHELKWMVSEEEVLLWLDTVNHLNSPQPTRSPSPASSST